MYGDFVWWVGVVEDRKDPEKLNRARVRVFGYHSQSTSDIKTEDLPWATVMMPTTSAGTSGIHESPHGLVEGSWVLGFFRDGPDAQDPVIIGTVASQFAEAPQEGRGFRDPSGTYPKADYIGKADVNVHARGDSSEVVSNKISTVTLDVPTASGATWSEPETPYAPEYPYNHVVETESGHITELDDTTGAERIHEYHRSGTFREVYPDGTVVTRIVAKEYTVVAGDDFVNVKGNVKLTIDQSCDTYIKGDWNIKVDGNLNETIGLSRTTTIGQSDTESVGGSRSTTIGGGVTESFASRSTSISGSDSLSIGGKHTVSAPDASVVYSKGKIQVVKGDIIDTGVVLHTHGHSGGF